jgi:UDP-N-acetylmuramoylalanine--D-glutamate ligase
VSGVSLIGEAAGRMQAEWQGIVPLYRSATLEEAVAMAVRSARSGEAVVLSPGCSSFDMFVDYQERGDRFKKIVAALAAERTA